MSAGVDEHIGRRLYQRRRLLSLTQQQLGSACGLSFQQIHRYECAATHMPAHRLFQLAAALGVSVDYFFEGLAPSPDPAASEG